MATYTVDSELVASSAARVAASSETIRAEVASLMADLVNLQGTWAGAASASFSDCVTQWQATQAQVESALTAIGTQLGTAASVYAEAEAQSTALFAGR
ncbi:WXG100 family type VII secretion target [Schaalia sp. Marseille-Q2122]|uniref:WXG100 family type VII secretion target n=1 Tax=Schaalia sp. Marseille-Q2122 TaxID=2736604 RepID=UPI00158B8008|nr:WXG100 family type VII secretion target [Schaalia sp. Marseille-Q2122]